MPQNIRLGIHEMVAKANELVETLDVAGAIALHERDDIVLVDLRDPREIARDGAIPGAVKCPRGMLEFWIDPDSPYHKPVFARDARFVFFCAGGWRSALAARTALEMGLAPVAHIAGGFRAWAAAGGPIDKPTGEGRSA